MFLQWRGRLYESLLVTVHFIGIEVSTKYLFSPREEIVQAVSRPNEEDDKLIVVEPAVPSRRKAYACLSTCIW